MLRDCDVTYLPDNDDAGERGAAVVAGGLMTSGVAASIAVLRLPGLAEHGDVYDWIRDRRTAGDSDTMIGAKLAIVAARLTRYERVC
jgi:hypothetical protein